MADKEQAAAEQGAPEDNQDIDKVEDAESDVVSAPPLSPSADGFPIEGESEWVSVMRGIAFFTMLSVIIMAAVFHFLTDDDGFVEIQQLGMMLGGLVFLLVLAYFFFLIVVIPRQANYGRYIIHENQVVFYPLTTLGLGIRGKGELVDVGKFMGLTTGLVVDKKGKSSYAVYLVHATDKGKTINIKSFPSTEEAGDYAKQLGNVLRLNVAIGKHKAAEKV